MALFECGFLAGGPDDQGKSNQIFNATLVPVRSTSTTLSVPFQGGWAFALAANADGDLYSWGVNHMTVRGKKCATQEGLGIVWTTDLDTCCNFNVFRMFDLV